MTPRVLKTLLVAFIVATTATSAHAILDLTGVTVQGELFINGGLTNLFDPVNGKVPAGFGNSPFPGGSGEAEAIVSDSIVEFGYQGGTATFMVNFSTTGVVNVSATSNPFTTVSMNFFSPAFTPSVTLTTVTASPSITTGFTNNTFTVAFNGMSAGPFSSTQYLNVAGTPPPQVPEPASMTLMGLGLVGIILRNRKRT